jgi:hypothetical protein
MAAQYFGKTGLSALAAAIGGLWMAALGRYAKLCIATQCRRSKFRIAGPKAAVEQCKDKLLVRLGVAEPRPSLFKRIC